MTRVLLAVVATVMLLGCETMASKGGKGAAQATQEVAQMRDRPMQLQSQLNDEGLSVLVPLLDKAAIRLANSHRFGFAKAVPEDMFDRFLNSMITGFESRELGQVTWTYIASDSFTDDLQQLVYLVESQEQESHYFSFWFDRQGHLVDLQNHNYSMSQFEYLTEMHQWTVHQYSVGNPQQRQAISQIVSGLSTPLTLDALQQAYAKLQGWRHEPMALELTARSLDQFDERSASQEQVRAFVVDLSNHGFHSMMLLPIFADQKRPKALIWAYQKLPDLLKQSQFVAMDVVDAYSQQNKHSEALNMAYHTVALNPNTLYGYLALAKAASKAGDYELAARTLSYVHASFDWPYRQQTWQDWLDTPAFFESQAFKALSLG